MFIQHPGGTMPQSMLPIVISNNGPFVRGLLLFLSRCLLVDKHWLGFFLQRRCCAVLITCGMLQCYSYQMRCCNSKLFIVMLTRFCLFRDSTQALVSSYAAAPARLIFVKQLPSDLLPDILQYIACPL